MKKYLVLFVFMALAACGDKEPPKVDEAPPPAPQIKVEKLICPQVAILRQAEEVFDYGRAEREDASQLVARAKLLKIDGDCGYRKGGMEESGIDVSFRLHGVAQKTDRLGGDKIGFPYFIALVDPADRVIRREVMTAEFTFSGDKKVAELEEPLHVFVPLAETNLPSGPDYRVLIGFIQPGLK